jgi:hypothetical protein
MTARKANAKADYCSVRIERRIKAEGDLEERGLQIHFRESRLRSPGERTATSKTTQNY